MAKDKHKEDKPNFEDILKTPASDVIRPKPVPQGSYIGMTVGLPRHDKSTKKQTPYSEYTIQLQEVYMNEKGQSDVDEDALNEALTKGNGDVVSLREKSLKYTFYHTPDALWRLVKFIRDLGFEIEKGVPIEEYEDASPGRQVVVHIKHDPSPDGETMFANIDKTAPVD